MDKKQLDSILKNAYNLPLWRQVLTEVFGARNLNQTPPPILLPSNDLAKEAFELGFFNTTDDRIIGLYQIDLKDKVKIERNKVGLRELLRSVYKYDVDGALVVFVQNDKWRLSFVSEIRVLNDDGTIDTKATEPKRYTYLLGKGEKTKTPTDRLALLTNKKIALEDIRQAFSVEALNNEFYKQISEYFYQLVGATTTKGKKTEVRPKTMKLPGVADDDRKTYQEFAVRLIGRTVFCWFLREKCSEQNKPLLPEKLLSSNAVGANKNYYHEVLEPLFFQTLNTPMDKRIKDLPEGCEVVPFLNGGLFEPQNEDFYNAESKTGNYQQFALKIPDSWFAEFFAKLEEYNFTIDENSPTEVEISVDPEMLGRIFENLLAEIDPDSGETARKATGSFYTPREIVNYMVDESLLIYLKSVVSSNFSLPSRRASPAEGTLKRELTTGQNDGLEAKLRRLFSYSDNENPFGEDDTQLLIDAIAKCKILDPACGSGAFPIGVLQRLVHLLGKLDADDKKWKEWLKRKAINDTEKAYDEGDVSQRNERLRQISEAFEKDSSDFGRKLFLIENCIYGVDIQPIAAEISKLRCFLTLIVDDTIDEAKPNRGVNPLPNLEFKFVTADALLKLPASGLFQATTETQMSELEQIRHEYINSYGAGKESAKGRFKQIQDEIFDAQIKNNRENPDKRAIALSTWNPFGHAQVDWFDSLWMFGVKGFDIVIGNPPYVRPHKISPEYKKILWQTFKSFVGKADLYCCFVEKSIDLLRQNGAFTFIISDGFLRLDSFEMLRKIILENVSLNRIIDYEGNVFDSATVKTAILAFSKNKATKNHLVDVARIASAKKLDSVIFTQIEQQQFRDSYKSIFDLSINSELTLIKDKIRYGSIELGSDFEISFGLKTGDDSKFIMRQSTSAKHKPLLRGENIQRYSTNFNGEYVYYDPLKMRQHKITARPGTKERFEQPKLLVRDTGNGLICTFDDKNFYVKDVLIVSDQNFQIKKLKTLTSILNSKLMKFFYETSFPTLHVQRDELASLPIKFPKEKQKPFENLVDYILFLKATDAAEQVNEYVPNSHLVEQFEEVIDALVYELYFEEDFRTAKIEFLKYAARDFPPIERLARPDKIKTVHAAYQRLRQKDNEIRNNLKLMDIRLADLIMPIKTAR